MKKRPDKNHGLKPKPRKLETPRFPDDHEPESMSPSQAVLLAGAVFLLAPGAGIPVPVASAQFRAPSLGLGLEVWGFELTV